MRQLDFYDILGVPATASDSEIRAAHRRMVKSVHPDVGNGADAERFRLVQLAYETLIDSDSRAQYDLTRPRPRPRPKPRATAESAEERAERRAEQRAAYAKRKQQRPKGPVYDWTPGYCWKCHRRDGQPRLRVTMEKAGAPTHIVAIPHCDRCRTPIPQLPMATADFVVFSSAMGVAALFVALFLSAGISSFSGLGIVLFWATCAVLLVGAVPMTIDFRRRIPSGYQRRANILVKYVADYPTVAKLFDKGYLIVT